MSAGLVMWRMCEGKARLSRADAERVAWIYRHGRKARQPRIRAYECECCGFFHLGHTRHSGKQLRAGGV
jgi:hypothetical protein